MRVPESVLAAAVGAFVAGTMSIIQDELQHRREAREEQRKRDHELHMQKATCA